MRFTRFLKGEIYVHGPRISLSYILYGDLSHTFCIGISSTLRAPILYTYEIRGPLSHTFCVGTSLIHFVWGFLSYILYGD